MMPLVDPVQRSTRTIRIVGWSVLAAIFMGPVIAMRLTAELAWTGLDFALFGALLIMIGLGCDLVVRHVHSGMVRLAWAMTLGTAAGLTLANGAVGLMGGEGAEANALFGLVLGVLVIGTAGARARAGRMAYVLGAAAGTQLAVVSVILLAQLGPPLGAARWDALISGPGFALLWLMAAYLFQKAAKRPSA
jgi:hypothetical protein